MVQDSFSLLPWGPGVRAPSLPASRALPPVSEKLRSSIFSLSLSCTLQYLCPTNCATCLRLDSSRCLASPQRFYSSVSIPLYLFTLQQLRCKFRNPPPSSSSTTSSVSFFFPLSLSSSTHRFLRHPVYSRACMRECVSRYSYIYVSLRTSDAHTQTRKNLSMCAANVHVSSPPLSLFLSMYTYRVKLA